MVGVLTVLGAGVLAMLEAGVLTMLVIVVLTMQDNNNTIIFVVYFAYIYISQEDLKFILRSRKKCKGSTDTLFIIFFL